MKINQLLITIMLVFISALSLAEDDYSHAKGLPADTLAQAVANYDLYNQKFAALLKQELTPESMHEIHMLSYTLENALETMAAELSQHRDDLERVHKASETMKADQIIKFGNKYLDTSSRIQAVRCASCQYVTLIFL